MKAIFKYGKVDNRIVTLCAVVENYSDGSTVAWLGVSFQNPKDEYNRELGNIIAKGKALKDKTCLGFLECTNKRFLDIHRIMENELERILYHPELYIKGYKP